MSAEQLKRWIAALHEIEPRILVTDLLAYRGVVREMQEELFVKVVKDEQPEIT